MDEFRLLNVQEQAEGCQGALDLFEALLYPLGILRWFLRGAVEEAVIDEEQGPDIGRGEGEGYSNLETSRQINGGEDGGNTIALRRPYVEIKVC